MRYACCVVHCSFTRQDRTVLYKDHEHERTMLSLVKNGGRAVATVLLACPLFLASLRCEAQINLVRNGSFEERDTCPYTIGFQEGDRPLYWYSWLNSPEYFNACVDTADSLAALVGVPQNGWTFQYPWDGDAYVGMVTYYAGESFREYVGTELVEPMQLGCTYLLRFRTNPAYGGNYWLVNGGTACDNVGMLFTTVSNAWTAPEPWPPGPDFPFRNHAHLRTTVPVTDTVAWTLVEGIFVADSAYQYLVLGNFFPDSLTTAVQLDDAEPWYGISYYLIDGVEVIPLDQGCNGLGVQEARSDEGPDIRWTDGRIQVRWDGKGYSAEVMDALGRMVGRLHAAGAWMDMPQPSAGGMYYLRLCGNGKQHVVKFVVR